MGGAVSWRVLSEALYPSVLGELTPHPIETKAVGGEFLLRADGQGPPPPAHRREEEVLRKAANG